MKYILFLSVFLFSVASFSQISDAENTPNQQTIGVGDQLTGYPILKYVVEGDMKRYTLIYKNQGYNRADNIKSFNFLSNDIGLDYLYEFLMDSFNKKDEREIRIGDVIISAKKVKSSIKVTVKHPDEDSGWFNIKQNPLERLFGKG